MNIPHPSRWYFAVALVGLGLAVGLSPTALAQEYWPAEQEGLQVLTRGPVHEAFAETITYDPQPGIVIMRAPPERIEEIPPDQRPDGINVEWIPGYWAWDDERSDFLWVSGVWRELPPGREWVPGYWARTRDGHQWISGYWADTQQQVVQYLPEPPITIEAGPNVLAPSPDFVWVPGSWVWYNHRYAWRPGYWVQVQPDWAWIPAHYVCTPRGYVYVNGYWDYAIARRGVLYAPVYVDVVRHVHRRVSYRPVTVIHLSVFTDHLFVRPRYNHYYFGDYYATSYRSSGFYASFSFHSERHGYDPIFAHERWRHRHEPDWDHRIRDNYRRRCDHEDERPRRTLSAQISYSKTDARRAERGFRIAEPVQEFTRRSDSSVRFRQVDQHSRQQVTQRAREVQDYRKERQKTETKAFAKKATNRSEPVQVKARRSPIKSTPGDRTSRVVNPPKRPEAPRPDPSVERKSRKSSEPRSRTSRK